ncbi:hypothetical protein C1H46_040744 [Malus baccata]|uniref:Uncharacterized protein n=1 Tax=Malus baccata TaxID=106549 RepID=A0A540KHS2_MALBA|nr:hypothetical protein C1H46_040744 [Malus baccata]
MNLASQLGVGGRQQDGDRSARSVASADAHTRKMNLARLKERSHVEEVDEDNCGQRQLWVLNALRKLFFLILDGVVYLVSFRSLRLMYYI